MNETTLSADQVTWIIVVGIAALATAWCVTFYVLRNKPESLKWLLAGGNALKIMTVMFLVFATGILAILGRFEDSIATVFSGIAGYVLGSMNRNEDKPQADRR